MSAAPGTSSACRRCGGGLPHEARFCPTCGAAVDPAAGPPLAEDVPGPVTVSRVERRWLGLPAPLVLLCAGFAALGGAIGLFAAGHWPWGLVLAGVTVVLLGGWSEVARRRPQPEPARRAALLLADRRQRAASTSAVWRARLDAVRHRRHAHGRLDAIEDERRPALLALGEAAHAGDAEGETAARARLAELDEERQSVERTLAERLEEAGERIRLARLPVDRTVMVAPTEPNAPYPPPGEGNPPQPAQVPEPYPPPDEGTPPTPAPDPGTERDE